MSGIVATQPQPRSAVFQKLLVEFRVVISSIAFTLMIGLNLWLGMTHTWSVRGDVYGRVGAVLVLVGLAIRSWAAGVLYKGRALATSGPFSLCRHPLYVGSFAMMLGFGLILGDAVLLVPLSIFVFLIYRATIFSEERRIASCYPNEWPAYAASTPRFFSFRARYRPAAWRADLWMRNREYNALAASLVGLVAIEIWQLL